MIPHRESCNSPLKMVTLRHIEYRLLTEDLHTIFLLKKNSISYLILKIPYIPIS